MVWKVVKIINNLCALSLCMLNFSLNLGPEILNSREEVLQGEEWSSEQGQVLDSDLWAQLPSLGILTTDHHSYIC